TQSRVGCRSIAPPYANGVHCRFMLQIKHADAAPGAVVITLSGKILMGPESEQIVALVDTLLEDEKRTIIFDLADVTRIDSTGIGCFIASSNKIERAGGEMRMAGATRHLLDVFHVTLLDTVFPFYPDVEAACKGLAN